MNVQSNAQSAPNGGLLMMVMAIGAVAAAAGLVMTFSGLMSEGHGTFGSGSNVAWGLPVVVYLHLVLTSSGLTILASLAMVFGFKQYYPLAKRAIWLALVTLVAGFASLALELGHPFRMLWALPFSFQIQSVMWWMGALYAADLVFMLWKFQRMSAGDWDSQGSKMVGLASLVAVLLASAALGMVFGVMGMRPMWFGGFVPLFFIITGVCSAVATLMLFTQIAHGFSRDAMPEAVRKVMDNEMPKLMALMIAIVLAGVLIRTYTGAWGYFEGFEAFQIITGSVWFHVSIWIGMLLPLLLMLSPSQRTNPTMQIVTGLTVLLGLLITRYQFVVAGQEVPLFKGTWMPGFVGYVPSTTEWMLMVFAFGFVLFAYAVGEKMLRLSDTPQG